MFDRLFRIKILKNCFASIVPRYLVLLIDMFLVLVACIFSLYVVKVNDHSELFFDVHTLVNTVIILAVFALMSRITKSYWGIIRYTGLEDAYRLFKMITLSCLVLLVMSVAGHIAGHQFLSFIEIVELGIFTFTFILLERLAIKALYHRIASEKSQRKKVVVLGSAINSVIFANSLLHEIDGKYEPVALLSLSDSRQGDSVSGLPIEAYNPDRIGRVFEKYRSKTLIFLATHMEMMKKGLADKFLEAGIELLLLNQVEEFGGKKEHSDVSSHIYNINIDDLLGREPIRTDNPNVSKMLKDRVVMVTGAAGSIGGEIVRQLAMFRVASVVLVDQAETPMHNMQLELEKNFPKINIHLFIADVQNKDRLRQAFDLYRPDYVFHAAAYKHVPMMESNPTEAIMTNVGGTCNVADLAFQYNVEKFVMISTDKAVNPTNIMGCSKRIAEIYVQSLYYEMKRKYADKCTAFITTRFGNVLGSNGSVVPLFKEQIAQGGPVTVTHRDIIRYFMTIPEACNLVLEAGCMGRGGEIFIFDMGNPVKIYDLAKQMIRLSGHTPGVDIQIVETGLRPGEKLFEELLNDKEKTTATYHSKIMIAQVRQYEYNYVLESVGTMLQQAKQGNAVSMVRSMKELVPEFVSRNSVYEELDKNVVA